MSNKCDGIPMESADCSPMCEAHQAVRDFRPSEATRRRNIPAAVGGLDQDHGGAPKSDQIRIDRTIPIRGVTMRAKTVLSIIGVNQNDEDLRSLLLFGGGAAAGAASK